MNSKEFKFTVVKIYIVCHIRHTLVHLAENVCACERVRRINIYKNIFDASHTIRRLWAFCVVTIIPV